MRILLVSFNQNLILKRSQDRNPASFFVQYPMKNHNEYRNNYAKAI